MELTTEQICGIIISIIVIFLLIYWLITKIKTKRPTFSLIEKGTKKSSEFTQGILNDVDKVLSELNISARKDNTISFNIHQGQKVRYADINLTISTDAWYIALIEYCGQNITIHSREINRYDKLKNFFIPMNNPKDLNQQLA
jgi:hypothetical protein